MLVHVDSQKTRCECVKRLCNGEVRIQISSNS